MSKNINQIFISNPASSMQDDDLMYLGRSPYGLTNDMAILWSDIIASLGTRYLERANNLSDLSNQLTAYQNFGMGARSQVTYTDVDFPVVLTNPCPNIITLNCSSPGHVLQLPNAQGTQSFELFNGPEIINIGSERVDIVSFLGVPQTPSQPNSDFDYLLTDKSTTGGLWDPRGHVTTVNGQTGNVVLTSSLSTIYVSNSGDDVLGDGTVLKPYATLSHALASVTPSPANPYMINMATGLYSETNLVLKANVYIEGNQSTLSVSGSVTLDVDWSAGGFLYIQNFASLSLPASVSLDFTAVSAPSALFVFQNNIIGSNTTLFVKGAIFISKANFGGGFQIHYQIEQCYGALTGGACGDLEITDTGFYSVIGMTEIGNATVTWTQSGGMQFTHMASQVIGNTVYQSTGNGTLTVIEKGITHNGTLTLDNGTSGGNVILDAATLSALPILLNGATYSPTSISEAVAANNYFTPVNYTPVSGGPGLWAADSVTGNLAGIDAALAGTAIGVYQQLYVNDTFGNDSNSGSIAEPFKTYEAARLKAVSLSPSVSNLFVINMIGVFSITGNMTITPFVSVLGTSDYSSRISLTGNVVLDNAWNTTNNPFSLVGKLNIVTSGSISLTYTTFRPASFIRFENCSLQISSVVASGSGTNTQCERIIFNNCNTDGFTEPTFTVDNVDLFLFNTNPSNNMTVSVTSATSLASFILTGAQSRTGNITLNAASTGTLTTTLSSSNTFGKTLTINGTNNTVHVDSTSYMFTLALAGGATLSSLILPTKTDGMVNTSYTPLNYTPVSNPSLYQTDSLTGNLRGIDVKLGLVSSVVPSQMIFLDANSGDDSNPGTIAKPLKTYEAANTLAISRNPHYGSGQTIVIMSSVQTVADLVLVPYVDIFGFGWYNSIIGVTNSISLHSSWGTVSIPAAQIMNIAFVGKNINLVYPAFQSDSLIRFQNCSLQLTDGSSPATITGSNGSGTIRCETVIFDKCNLDIQVGVAEPTYNGTNVNLYFWDTNISSGVTSNVTSATIHAKLIIQNTPYLTGQITVHAAAAGTLTTYIGATNTAGATLTINGTSNTVNVDATSYQFSLVLAGGATLSNLVLPTKTDGMVNTSYTPANYTPTGGASFSSNTLTGNLKGIDLAIASVGGGVIPSQLIFLDANTGNDSNTGTMTSPLKTYEAANALAISRSPAYGSGQTIVLMSSVQTVADLVLVPFVDIFGFGMYNSILGVTGSIVLHASWGTMGGGPTCQIINTSFVASNINLVYPAFQDGSLIRFQNCAIQLLDGGAPATITGSDGSGSTGCETVIFDKCNLDISQTIQEPTYNGTNVNMFFWNTNLSSGVTSTVTSSTVQATLIIQDSAYLIGNITLNATAAGTLTTYIEANDTQFTTLTINGTSNTVNIDATSYQFSSIVFSGGATLSNINLPTLTDGLTNGSYSPVNYTPSSGSNFQSTSLTGNLKGIDTALPKASGSATLVGGTVTVLSSSVASGDSIQLTRTASGGVPGFPVVTYSAGVSFTITSTSALDTSTFKWKNLGA